MTRNRKALLAVAVAALLAVPGIAMASGAFGAGDDHPAAVEDHGTTTTIGQEDSREATVGTSDDLAGDCSDDLAEAAEVEDSADDLDAAEVEAEAESEAEDEIGADDQGSDGFDDGSEAADVAGAHN